MIPIRSILPSNKFQMLYWYDLISSLPMAALVLIFLSGILFLFYGKSIFKWIVILHFAGIGFYLGWLLATNHGREWIFATGFGLLAGILAWPLLRFAVAILCGFMGLAFASQISLLFIKARQILSVLYLTAFIAFAILGWFLLIPAVILFTSIEGAILAILAGLAIAERFGVIENARWVVFGRTSLLLFFILALTILGLFYQLGIGHRHLTPTVEEPTERKIED